jgi:hypothetical protein
MPKIEIQEQKFFNEYINGVNFDENLDKFTPNLTGEVGERIKSYHKLRVSWESEATSSNRFRVTYIASDKLKIERFGGSFLKDGFSTGDTCRLRYKQKDGTEIIREVEITSADALYLYVTLTLSTITEAQVDNISSDIVKLTGLSTLNGLIFRYNLIENNDSENYTSELTDNDISFYTDELDQVITWRNLQPKSKFKDFVTGTPRVKYISRSLVTGVQVFEVENTFVIPYYEEGQEEEIKAGILPDNLKGENSLKYIFDVDFRTIYTDENTSKKQSFVNQKGDVGGYDETFSGFVNDYVVNSVTYTDADLLTSADGILSSGKTKINISASKVSGSFIASDKIGFYLSYLPLQTEYQNTITDFQTNFMYESAFSLCDGVAVTTGDLIKSIKADLNAGDIDVEVEVEYDVARQLRLSDTSKYLISLQMGNITKDAIASDRSNNLVDIELYDLSSDIPDLIGFDTFNQLPHDLTLDSDVGYTDMVAWNESGIITDFKYWLDLSKSAVLDNLKYAIIAYNSVTNSYFILDEYNYNLSYTDVANGVQQLETLTNRGYNLLQGDQFNIVRHEVAEKIGDKQYYTSAIGQKISWEDWFQNLDVDRIFYDITKPSRNLNYRTSNYSGLNDYVIHAAVIAEVSGVSTLGRAGTTTYLHKSAPFTVYDYKKDGNPSPVWLPTIKTYDNDNDTDLNGGILTDKYTRFEIEWDNTVAPPLGVDNFWAIHRIQPTGDLGKDIQELSTIWDYPADNKLVPTDFISALTIGLVGSKVTTKGLIDYTKLKPGVRYDLSGELRSPNNFQALPPGVKITEDGTAKTTEDGTYKVIE